MRWNRRDGLAALLFAVGLLLLSSQRSLLAEQHHRLVSTRDVYQLPPPRQTVVLSLGYRAAAADLIFGHLLVSVGLHMSEKRLFEFAGAYLETINELDPKFRDPYRYSDAILTLQVVPVPDDMYRQARSILLRGTRELPFDQQLWAAAGQFLAYLAPGALDDPAEAEAFRQEGARLLARACELIGSNENIPYHCVTAASLFSEAGNRAASRAFLEKLRVVSDDPGIHALVDGKLAIMDGEDAKLQGQLRARRFEQLWRDDLPFVSRAGIAALGPRFDPASCAGSTNAQRPECATSLRERMAARVPTP